MFCATASRIGHCLSHGSNFSKNCPRWWATMAICEPGDVEMSTAMAVER